MGKKSGLLPKTESMFRLGRTENYLKDIRLLLVVVRKLVKRPKKEKSLRKEKKQLIIRRQKSIVKL